MNSNRSQIRCEQSMWNLLTLTLVVVTWMAEDFDYKTVHVGEGCASTMGSMRITSSTAPSPEDLPVLDVMKTHGRMPRKELAPTDCVRKRSYRRAVKRAAQEGYSWYRGRILTPAQIDDIAGSIMMMEHYLSRQPNYHRVFIPDGLCYGLHLTLHLTE